MNRLIFARLLLAIAITATIGAVEIGSLVSPLAPAQPGNSRSNIAENIPTLPTIAVHAPETIPTLPLVLVRPSMEQLATAPELASLISTSTSGSTPTASAGLPHVRLDMPYYSFGKMLPNVIKD